MRVEAMRLAGALLLVLGGLAALSLAPVPGMTARAALASGSVFGRAASPAPEFLASLSAGSAAMTEEGWSLGYVPSPVDLSGAVRASPRVAAKAAASLPVRYDLRAIGRMAPTRDQGNCGACWAYSSLTALATEQLPDQRADFSEDHLLDRHGYDLRPCDGGNALMAAAYMARWEGPAIEIGGRSAFAGRESQVRILPDRRGPADNDVLKQAVMADGAVSTTLYYGDAFYNRSTFAYRNASPSAPNHAVTIIGWDDDFPGESFRPAAPGKGAFIAQNSWGPAWGQGGCFYVSYHDVAFGKRNFQFKRLEKATSRDRVYQHDELGWTTSWLPGGRSVWLAAIFMAEGPEPITSVGFWTGEVGTIYEARLRVLDETEPVAPSDETGAEVAASGALDYAGYYVVRLGKPLALAPGQRFLVAVRLVGAGQYVSAPLEASIPGYSSAARASLGESFLSVDGVSWMDVHAVYPNASVCLKAISTARDQVGSGFRLARMEPALRLLFGTNP